jgi:opacity protein-like surface antigen
MKAIALAAIAAATVATPAAARDGQPYVGIEGGLLSAQDLELDAAGVNEGVEFDIDDAVQFDFNRGIDLDLVAGYDFGSIRGEAELGYKKVAIDEVGGNAAEGTQSADGDANVWSLMGNVLFDVGDPDGLSFYGGGGLGWAQVKLSDVESGAINDIDGKDSGLAWQLIAGVRYALSQNVDLGVKYRYFRAGGLDFGDLQDAGNLDDFDGGRFRSHSLLASLIFNFGAAPPPPPPPPPASGERG